MQSRRPKGVALCEFNQFSSSPHVVGGLHEPSPSPSPIFGLEPGPKIDGTPKGKRRPPMEFGQSLMLMLMLIGSRAASGLLSALCSAICALRSALCALCAALCPPHRAQKAQQNTTKTHCTLHTTCSCTRAHSLRPTICRPP